MSDAPPSWINKGTNPLPGWLQPHVAGKREPNGCFIIHTLRARDKVQARVLVGNIVLEFDGVAHTGPAEHGRMLLEELQYAKHMVADELAQRAANPAPNAKTVPGAPSGTTPTTGKDAVVAAKPRISAAPPPKARKQSYPAAKGARPTIEWLHLDRLSMDVSYQRSTDNDASRRLIASIAANFDWRLCTPLVVSRRPDGTFPVIDGQHRLLAARLRGMDDLPCCVFTYDSAEEEAKMFVAANRSRKAMNRLDDFHAAMAAGDSDAHQVLQLVTDAGLSIARNTASAAWKPGEIAFTASIASSIKKHGRSATGKALKLIAEAFPDQKVVHSGSIFLGLVKFMTVAEPRDPDRVFRALLKYSAEEWGSFVAGLKGGDTRATAIREALMMAYEEAPQEAVQA